MRNGNTYPVRAPRQVSALAKNRGEWETTAGFQTMIHGVFVEHALLAEVRRMKSVIDVRDVQVNEQHERL
jgi:hypothetical protein